MFGFFPLIVTPLYTLSSLQLGLQSEDYGNHLLGVEDLLQKHVLVEADITAQEQRVQQSNRDADEFLEKAAQDDSDGMYCWAFGFKFYTPPTMASDGNL